MMAGGEHPPSEKQNKPGARVKGDNPMKVLMVRAKVKDEYVAEIESAGERLFAALHREQPQGIRYTTCRLSDSVTYVNIIAIDDGIDNPLLALPEARTFQEGLKQWLAEPPTSEQLTVLGSYRFF
jgi:hypothetical protein